MKTRRIQTRYGLDPEEEGTTATSSDRGRCTTDCEKATCEYAAWRHYQERLIASAVALNSAVAIAATSTNGIGTDRRFMCSPPSGARLNGLALVLVPVSGGGQSANKIPAATRKIAAGPKGENGHNSALAPARRILIC